MNKRTERIILLFAALLGLTVSAWATNTQLTTGWDAGLSRWGNDGHRNSGGNTSYSPNLFETDVYLLKFDVSSLGSGITVTAVSCSLKMGWSGSERSFRISGRMTTDWTEGVEIDDTVSVGNPGVTYKYATDVPPSGSAGANTGWVSSLLGSGDYTSTRDSATCLSGEWVVFDSSNLNTDVEGWANGTFSNYGWVIECTNPASDRTLNTFEAATNKPRMWVVYTTGGGGPTGQIIMISGGP